MPSTSAAVAVMCSLVILLIMRMMILCSEIRKARRWKMECEKYMNRLFNRNDNLAVILAGIFSIIIGLGISRFVFTSLIPSMLDNFLTITFAGILASLNWAKEINQDWVLTLPCDTPFLPKNLVQSMVEVKNKTPEVDLVVAKMTNAPSE